MNCNSCGTPLQQGIFYCPQCRKATPYLTGGPSQPPHSQQGQSFQQGTAQNAYGYPPAPPQERYQVPPSGYNQSSFPSYQPVVDQPAPPQYGAPAAFGSAPSQFGVNNALTGFNNGQPPSYQSGPHTGQPAPTAYGQASFSQFSAYNNSLYNNQVPPSQSGPHTGQPQYGANGTSAAFTRSDEISAFTNQAQPGVRNPSSSFQASGNSSSLSAYRPKGDSATAAPAAMWQSSGAGSASPPAAPFNMAGNSPAFVPSNGGQPFGGGVADNSPLASQFSMNANPTFGANLPPQQMAYAMPAASMPTYSIQQTSRRPLDGQRSTATARSKSRPRGKGWIMTTAIITLLLIGLGASLVFINPFRSSANPGQTSTPSGPVLKAVAASATIPATQAIAPAAAAIIGNLQLSNALDNNTYLPTHVTTSFSAGQAVYASFTIDSKKLPGFIQVQWYQNNQVIAVGQITHDPQYNVGYFNHQYAAGGDGAVALYWCQKQDCSDGLLAQVARFNVAAPTTPADSFSAPTSWESAEHRRA